MHRLLALLMCMSWSALGCANISDPSVSLFCLSDDDCPRKQRCAVDVQRCVASRMQASGDRGAGDDAAHEGPGPDAAEQVSAAPSEEPAESSDLPSSEAPPSVPGSMPAPAADGGVDARCVCGSVDACCDGCLPINELGGCASDELDCTQDLCRAGVCAHELSGGFCFIDGVCFEDGQERPSSRCQYCDVGSDPQWWTDRPEHSPCDDGYFCNGEDTCGGAAQSGNCWNHSGNPCTSDDACLKCDEEADECAYATKEVWYDAQTGLTWPTSPSLGSANWVQTRDFCSALTFCGQSDWRMPTIGELRGLARECASDCGVDDSCLSSSCFTSGCDGCSGNAAPRSILVPQSTWSSSRVTGEASQAWGMHLGAAQVFSEDMGTVTTIGGRCVRIGQ